MNYSALDRFQGVWLGGIIGFAMSNNLEQSDYEKLHYVNFPNWIAIRNEIANIVIQNQPEESILKQIIYFLDQNSLSPQAASVDNPERTNSLLDQTYRIDLKKHQCYMFLILLSLTIIQGNNDNVKKIHNRVLSRYCGTSIDTTQIEQEFVIWNYLLTSTLNSQLQFNESNVSMIIEQILSGVKVKAHSLTKKLEIVSQAWERSLSLSKLIDELYEQENQESTIKPENSLFQPSVSFILAMSFYCFISTPRNFMLSVKRAAYISSKLSVPITIFTASISGAYNGIASIPRSWRLAANHHQLYRQGQVTAQNLFQSWLGIHDLENSQLPYSNSELYVVADPKIFQPRQNLKIISQNSTLG